MPLLPWSLDFSSCTLGHYESSQLPWDRLAVRKPMQRDRPGGAGSQTSRAWPKTQEEREMPVQSLLHQRPKRHRRDPQARATQLSPVLASWPTEIGKDNTLVAISSHEVWGWPDVQHDNQENLQLSRASTLIWKEMLLISLLSVYLNIMYCEAGMSNPSQGSSWPSRSLSER